MIKTVAYRDAIISDFNSFYEIFDSVAQEREFFGEVKAPNCEGLKVFFEEVVNKGHPFVVAEIDGEIIGWGHLYPMSSEPYAHNYVFAVSILKHYRGNGIGKALSAKLIDQLKSGIIRIEVLSTNKRAIYLYKSLRFRIDGERLNYVKIGEELFNLTLMSREI